MNVKTAIEQQNKAFIRKLNSLLGEPLTILELESHLEGKDPFLVAKLVIGTQKKQNEGSTAISINKQPSKFDRLLFWVKKQRD